jgi:predicted TIM-barrel fold metal-dependent hydrolase
MHIGIHLQNCLRIWLSLTKSHIIVYLDIMRDRLGVDRQLLNVYGPSVGTLYEVRESVAAQMAQRYNQAIHALCKQHKQFDYTAWLPMQCQDRLPDMLDQPELESAFAVFLGDQVPWGFMPQYEKIFQHIGAKQLPIYLHFADRQDCPASWHDSIDDRYHAWLARYPDPDHSWMITLASFVLSGWLSQHNLRIIVAEQGLQWLPEFRSAMQEINGVDPMPALREYFWFTTEPEEENFLPNANSLGFDRLLFATDWPHGSTDRGGSNQFHDADMLAKMLSLGSVSAEQYEQITHTNYVRIKQRTVF